MDKNGNWYECIVKVPQGDGTYICSVPLAHGVTLTNILIHNDHLRPRFMFNTEGLYEACDDEGVYWDVVLNNYIDKGHVRILVFGEDGTQYGELRTHWSQIRVKIHIGIPNMYEAMDRQGMWWTIKVNKRLSDDMYSFDCYCDGQVIPNLKAHHDDIKLKTNSGSLLLASDANLQSGVSQQKLAEHEARVNEHMHLHQEVHQPPKEVSNYHAGRGKGGKKMRPMKWGEHGDVVQLSLEEKGAMMINSHRRFMAKCSLPGQQRDDAWAFLIDWTWMEILKPGSSPQPKNAKAKNVANPMSAKPNGTAKHTHNANNKTPTKATPAKTKQATPTPPTPEKKKHKTHKKH